jgi:hypothetical protein
LNKSRTAFARQYDDAFRRITFFRDFVIFRITLGDYLPVSV